MRVPMMVKRLAPLLRLSTGCLGHSSLGTDRLGQRVSANVTRSPQ
jgi:hypothetical protein